MTARLLLLPDGDRKVTREVLSGCSLPEGDEEWPRRPERPRGIIDRGVFLDPFSPESQATYVIVDSKGIRRRRIEMPIEDVTESTVPDLWTWLAEHDPVVLLHLEDDADNDCISRV